MSDVKSLSSADLSVFLGILKEHHSNFCLEMSTSMMLDEHRDEAIKAEEPVTEKINLIEKELQARLERLK